MVGHRSLNRGAAVGYGTGSERVHRPNIPELMLKPGRTIEPFTPVVKKIRATANHHRDFGRDAVQHRHHPIQMPESVAGHVDRKPSPMIHLRHPLPLIHHKGVVLRPGKGA